MAAPGSVGVLPHIGMLTVYVYTWYWDNVNIADGHLGRRTYGGWRKYLTQLNFVRGKVLQVSDLCPEGGACDDPINFTIRETMASARISAPTSVVHLSLCCLYTYVEMYSVLYVWPHTRKLRPSFGGRFVYLTALLRTAHTIFFASCVLGDIVEGILGKKTAGLRKLQDYVVASVLFPTSMIVSVTFWAIYAIDRELIFPSQLDKIIPPWVNHVWHTTVVPFILLEMYLVHHKYPSRRAGLAGAIAVGVAYLIWLLIVAHVGGFWAYPFMAVMSPFQLFLFFCCNAVIGCVLYLTGEYINSLFWGPKEKPRKEKKKA